MEEPREDNAKPLLDAKLTRRSALIAGAWSAPVVGLAVAAPLAAASEPPFDPTTDLEVLALGGAEGRYRFGNDYTSGTNTDPSNRDFRRAFSIRNTGTATFAGSLTVMFEFPRMWNQGISANADAYSPYTTVDLGGRNGGSIGSASPWVTSAAAEYTQNVQSNGTLPAWDEVWLRMDPASVTLNNVALPPGGVVWFALDGEVPAPWIGQNNQYLPNGVIYWRTDIFIQATDTSDNDLGTFGPVPDPDTTSNWRNGIWYWNGGGPFAYDGGESLYPAYGNG
ncbi:hypothetical protein DY023_11260 [Microbacterium bovistercoris]|uniref:Uncharacterized protein n=1 Tax=Microbacterium bovistercoris TaxID=2293570 RepID=A0A371NTL7_9MICO|nr:hypothetical protein [Microbacterium bovistercoris]REJ05145.1 hypothetical protein DY023_11260 [Microbacterium bovistercoris]